MLYGVFSKSGDERIYRTYSYPSRRKKMVYGKGRLFKTIRQRLLFIFLSSRKHSMRSEISRRGHLFMERFHGSLQASDLGSIYPGRIRKRRRLLDDVVCSMRRISDYIVSVRKERLSPLFFNLRNGDADEKNTKKHNSISALHDARIMRCEKRSGVISDKWL